MRVGSVFHWNPLSLRQEPLALKLNHEVGRRRKPRAIQPCHALSESLVYLDACRIGRQIFS
jgi:hypothetical protein